MKLKALCATGVIISMLVPFGSMAFANDDVISPLEKKNFSTESQAISTTDTAIFAENMPQISATSHTEKPIFSVKAKTELEKPARYIPGECVILPDGKNFYREGYRFIGWNTDPSADFGFFEIVMEEDTVLYAIWEKEKLESTTESSMKFTTESSLEFTTESSIKYEETDLDATTESNIEFKENESFENNDFTQDSTTDSNVTFEDDESSRSVNGEGEYITESQPSFDLDESLEPKLNEDTSDFHESQEDDLIQTENENLVPKETTNNIDPEKTIHNPEDNYQEITFTEDEISSNDLEETGISFSNVSSDNTQATFEDIFS